MPKVLIDIAPLRDNAVFRRYYLGQMVSVTGSSLTVVAQRYQVYKLAGDSTTAVALLGLVTLVPLVLSSIVGGAIADSFDRRRILIVTQLLLAASSAGLAFNSALASPRLWLVYVLAAVSSALVGVDWPTRSSVIPNIVTSGQLHPALALNIAVFNVATIAGPVLAGFLVRSHLTSLYSADALSYGASLAAVLTLPSLRPAGERRTVSIETIKDGFRYVRGNRTIQSTFAADIGAMIFGLPDALFPAMAEKVFRRTYALGLLQAAPAAGALIGGALNGWTGRIRRQGIAVIWCIVVWGLGIALFGATRNIYVALFGLALAGGADAISALFRTTIVQVTVPDEYRGRLSAIFISVVRGGPRLGEMESGAAAAIGGLQFAAVTGGLACLAWIALVAWRYPELRAYERHHGDTAA